MNKYDDDDDGGGDDTYQVNWNSKKNTALMQKQSDCIKHTCSIHEQPFILHWKGSQFKVVILLR